MKCITQEYISVIECCCALLGKIPRKEYFVCTWTQHVHWQIMHGINRARCVGMLLSVEIASRPVMDGCELNWKCLRTEAKFISFTSWNSPRTSYIVVMYDNVYNITISERNHCHNTPRPVICFSWTPHCKNLSFNQKIRFLWHCYMSLIFPHCFFSPPWLFWYYSSRPNFLLLSSGPKPNPYPIFNAPSPKISPEPALQFP